MNEITRVVHRLELDDGLVTLLGTIGSLMALAWDHHETTFGSSKSLRAILLFIVCRCTGHPPLHTACSVTEVLSIRIKSQEVSYRIIPYGPYSELITYLYNLYIYIYII